MKRTHLLSLLMVLVLGGEGYFWHSFDKNSQYDTDVQLKQATEVLNDAGVKVIDDVMPEPMAEPPGEEPLFLRGRNANAATLHVFESFNAEFVNLRPCPKSAGKPLDGRYRFTSGAVSETQAAF